MLGAMNPNPGQYPPQGYGYPPPQQQQAPYPQYGYPPPYYAQQQQRNEDESHLNILSICHFIYAGIVGLLGLFFGIYIVLGLVMAASVASSGASGAAPGAAIGGIFVVIGGLAMLFTWGKAALLIVSGISMRRRRRRTLSFVVACISCLNIPMGTALGVFTLIVLNRPSVKALYDQAEYATGAAT